ncbi:MAG: membrane protein insertion efficiency factor YidD [Bacteroidota bacterium]
MLKKLIFNTAFLLILCFPVYAQDAPKSDMDLILNKETSEIERIDENKNRKRKFLIPKSDPLASKLNPLKWTLGGMLYFYQTSLSKHFSADCLYSPSCSNFSKDVIKHYGIAKGVFLTADRLSRCNRIAQTSLHPLSLDPELQRSKDEYSKYQFKQE